MVQAGAVVQGGMPKSKQIRNHPVEDGQRARLAGNFLREFLEGDTQGDAELVCQWHGQRARLAGFECVWCFHRAARAN